jgi:hypothetical protein
VNLFASSSWSSAALGAAGYGNEELQIEVANGTDALQSLVGFQFDQVRMTNVLVTGPDQQSDLCVMLNTCFEDNAPELAYSSGWHRVNDADASGGTFRLHLGTASTHSATLAFDVPSGAGTATVEYSYATSPKGGTADVYIDNVFRETISYAGLTGDTRNPTFGVSRTYGGLTAGSHTFELRNMRDAVYVDRLCLTNADSNAAPAAAPGSTSSSQHTIGSGQQAQSGVTVPLGASALSVAAVSDNGASFRLIVLNPLGGVVGIVQSSNGIAVVDAPVSASGLYVVQVLNLGLTPANVWTVSTPLLGN